MRKEKVTRTEEEVKKINKFIVAHGFKDMTEFAKAVGMERQNVWCRIRGRTDPNIRMLMKWAIVLNCDITELLELFYPREYGEYMYLSRVR